MRDKRIEHQCQPTGTAISYFSCMPLICAPAEAGPAEQLLLEYDIQQRFQFVTRVTSKLLNVLKNSLPFAYFFMQFLASNAARKHGICRDCRQTLAHTQSSKSLYTY